MMLISGCLKLAGDLLAFVAPMCVDGIVRYITIRTESQEAELLLKNDTLPTILLRNDTLPTVSISFQSFSAMDQV